MSEGVGLLLIGGEGPSRRVLEPLLPSVTCTVAADSGFDLARKLQIVPDLLVGDMDSLEDSQELRDFPTDRIRRYPPAKDETDAELGLSILWEMGCERVILAGGGGGRLDHLLALVSLFERGKTPSVWYTSREQIQVVEGTHALSNCRGQTVSFFPIGGMVSGMHSEGLRWPLDGLQWRGGDVGVSNVCLEDRCTVSVRRGRLLMVRTMGREKDAGKNEA